MEIQIRTLFKLWSIHTHLALAVHYRSISPLAPCHSTNHPLHIAIPHFILASRLHRTVVGTYTATSVTRSSLRPHKVYMHHIRDFPQPILGFRRSN